MPGMPGIAIPGIVTPGFGNPGVVGIPGRIVGIAGGVMRGIVGGVNRGGMPGRVMGRGNCAFKLPRKNAIPNGASKATIKLIRK